MVNTFVKSVKSQVKHWYLPVVLGVLFIAFGIFIFNTPIASYVSLAMLFSAIFLVAGISEIVFALSNKDQLDGFGWILFSGLIDFVLGLILVANPSFSMVVLPIYVGFGLLFRSMKGMGTAFDLKHYGNKSWFGLFIMAFLGLIFSIFMLANLEFGAFTIVYWTAFSFIMLGIYSAVFGLQLRKLKKFAGNVDDTLMKRFEEVQEEVRKKLHETE